MIIPFEQIPEESKIWVFPSSRKFYPQEISTIEERIMSFLNQWNNKDNAIKCSYKLVYNRFIIITADDTENSLFLEAHDSLIAFIQELESTFEVVLLDRINVCYKQGDFVQYKDLIAFKQLIKDQSVSKNTIVFNNMINTKEELEFDWEINIMDSWLGRFIK